MTTAHLKIIFFKKLSKYTDDNIFIASAFEQLFKNYTDGKRVYHHTTHVLHLLKLLDEYACASIIMRYYILRFGITMPFFMLGAIIVLS